MNELHLHAQGLLSKWGFSDGDVLDDWVFDNFPECMDLAPDSVLPSLVRDYLMPALSGWDIELEQLETSHNPIRALSVGGQPVDQYASGGSSFGFEYVSVSVPGERVLSALHSAGLTV